MRFQSTIAWVRREIVPDGEKIMGRDGAGRLKQAHLRTMTRAGSLAYGTHGGTKTSSCWLSLNHSFIRQILIVRRTVPGARDPAANKSCSLRREGCCPDLGSSRPAPCSWQPGSDLQSCLRRGIPISGHSSCRHVHLPSPSQRPAR